MKLGTAMVAVAMLVGLVAWGRSEKAPVQAYYEAQEIVVTAPRAKGTPETTAATVVRYDAPAIEVTASRAAARGEIPRS
jgi:hypothetical protein